MCASGPWRHSRRESDRAAGSRRNASRRIGEGLKSRSCVRLRRSCANAGESLCRQLCDAMGSQVEDGGPIRRQGGPGRPVDVERRGEGNVRGGGVHVTMNIHQTREKGWPGREDRRRTRDGRVGDGAGAKKNRKTRRKAEKMYAICYRWDRFNARYVVVGCRRGVDAAKGSWAGRCRSTS